MSSLAESLRSHSCLLVWSSCGEKLKPWEGEGFSHWQLCSVTPACSCLLITTSLLLHLLVTPPCHPRPVPGDT